MSFVAARTDSIRIAPNVLNVPLRPPAVVARAAASLDLLSGGRFDLALGAGGFWDAIEAMGGTRLTPGQAVDGARRGDRRHPRAVGHRASAAACSPTAEYHRVARCEARSAAGARDPDPHRRVQAAHARAHRPQGRRLAAVARLHAAGRPRPGQRGDRRGGRSRVGRDPREIRRLLNVGQLAADPGEFAERLAQLALEDGIGTFILAGDDPRPAAALRRRGRARGARARRGASGRPTASPPHPVRVVGRARRAPRRHRLRRRAGGPAARSSPATSSTATCAPPTCAAARRASCCSRRRPSRSRGRRLRAAASRAPARRSAAAATASAAAARTTAAS